MKNTTIERDFSYRGFQCVVLGTTMGHRCGYVGLSSSHPLYGCGYSEAPLILIKMWKSAKEGAIGGRGVIPLFCNVDDKPNIDCVFDVHGGITYAGGKDGYPVKSDLWWFGFDSAHCGDARDPMLMDEKYLEVFDRLPSLSSYGTVRTADYMVEQCKKLADQLSEVKCEEIKNAKA